MRRPPNKRSLSFSLLGLLGLLGLVAAPVASATQPEGGAAGSISGRVIHTADPGDLLEGEAILVAADATPQPFGEIDGEVSDWVTADAPNSQDLTESGDSTDAIEVVPVVARAELAEDLTFVFEDVAPGDYLVKLEIDSESPPTESFWWKDAAKIADAETIAVASDSTTDVAFVFRPSAESKKTRSPSSRKLQRTAERRRCGQGKHRSHSATRPAGRPRV